MNSRSSSIATSTRQQQGYPPKKPKAMRFSPSAATTAATADTVVPSSSGVATSAAAGRPRGCIRTTRGPWVVHRRTTGGGVRTSLRRPSEGEREKNRMRERRRRQVASRIFTCLKRIAGYPLPKHADHNDVLMALCREAGWNVDQDGTVYPKEEDQMGEVEEKEADAPEQKPDPELLDHLTLSLGWPWCSA